MRILMTKTRSVVVAIADGGTNNEDSLRRTGQKPLYIPGDNEPASLYV